MAGNKKYDIGPLNKKINKITVDSYKTTCIVYHFENNLITFWIATNLYARNI